MQQTAYIIIPAGVASVQLYLLLHFKMNCRLSRVACACTAGAPGRPGSQCLSCTSGQPVGQLWGSKELRSSAWPPAQRPVSPTLSTASTLTRLLQQPFATFSRWACESACISIYICQRASREEIRESSSIKPFNLQWNTRMSVKKKKPKKLSFSVTWTTGSNAEKKWPCLQIRLFFSPDKVFLLVLNPLCPTSFQTFTARLAPVLLYSNR